MENARFCSRVYTQTQLEPAAFRLFMRGGLVVGASSHEVTQLLQAWSSGDQAALDRLIPLVYDELHRLAHAYMMRASVRAISCRPRLW